MTRAGTFRDQIKYQEFTGAADLGGGFAKTWTDVAGNPQCARVTPKTLREVTEDGQVKMIVGFEVEVRGRPPTNVGKQRIKVTTRDDQILEIIGLGYEANNRSTTYRCIEVPADD